MGDTKSSIFSTMKRLNYSILVKGSLNDVPFSKATVDFFKFFEDYFKSGAFGRTEKVQFVLQNYATKNSIKVQLWNLTHDKPITETAIRVQESRINKSFTEVFGSPNDIERAFFSEDLETMSNLCDKVRVLKMGDANIDTYFTKDLLQALVKDSLGYSELKFDITECKSELEFLMRVSNQNILRLAESFDVDKNKLAYLVSLLSQPLMSNNYNINKKKVELATLMHKNLVDNTTIEGIVESSEFVHKQNQEKEHGGKDYQKMYFDLLNKYKDLEEQIKVQETNDINTELVVKEFLNENITIPSAVAGIIKEIAESYEGDTEMTVADAKEFNDTLYALTKYTMPIIGQDLAQLDERMLYFVWAALHKKLHIKGADEKVVTELLNKFSESEVEKVTTLQESDYMKKLQKLIKDISKEDGVYGE